LLKQIAAQVKEALGALVMVFAVLVIYQIAASASA
jgi:hypothetical protein